MNKEQLVRILNCCLFFFDGWNYESIINEGFSEQETQAGISLCKYLQGVEIK